MAEEKRSSIGEFFAFRSMISLALVKIIYVIGFIIITSFGVVTMVSGFSYYSELSRIFAGSVIILFGNILLYGHNGQEYLIC